MGKESYEQQASNLLKAIDIAIATFKETPPMGFTPQHVATVLETYFAVKNNIINAEPKFKTLTSLKYDIQVVFTYFNEATGSTVDAFWKKIKANNLPYERENRLLKILSKKKIKNQVEYDYVIDTMVTFKQEGRITDEQFKLLNELIAEFESKPKKK